MTPRDTQEQIGLFPVSNTPGSVGIDALIAEARHARQVAIAAGLRRFLARLGQALAVVGQALASWPERRAAYERLRGLSDRELADIGLTRGEIARVFDPAFQLPARAANANAPVAKPAAA